MEDYEKLDNKFLQSYVYGKHGSFFVSSIYRRSSAIDGGWFYETFAWEIDEQNKRKQHIIADNSGAVSEKGAIRQHNEVVEQLIFTGKFEESKED